MTGFAEDMEFADILRGIAGNITLFTLL